jgi:hypothetical protein
MKESIHPQQKIIIIWAIFEGIHFGKSSIYEVHQFSPQVFQTSPEIEYRSEKSILAMKEYKHFQ